ncbi:MAG: hypothetical protein ACREOO_08130 [bacterium]
MKKQFVLCVLALLLAFVIGCDKETTQPLQSGESQEVFRDVPYVSPGMQVLFRAKGDITIDGHAFNFDDFDKVHYLHPRYWPKNLQKVNVDCYTDYYTFYDETDIGIGTGGDSYATAIAYNSCTQGPRSFQQFSDVQMSGSGVYSQVRLTNFGWFNHPTTCADIQWSEQAIYDNLTISPTTWYGGLANDETVSNLSLVENSCSGEANTIHYNIVTNNDATKSLTVTRWMFSNYVYTP